MKKVLSYILLLVLILSLQGCALKKPNDITGTWYADMYGNTLTMKIDKGGIYNMELMDEAMIGTWVLEENTLYMDKGTSGEKSFSYDSAAQTLDGCGILFARKSVAASKPGKAVTASLEEFTGSWTVKKVEALKTLLPLKNEKSPANVTIDGTKVTLNIGFLDDEIKEGEAVWADGALKLTVPAASENGQETTYAITMMDTGMIRIASESADTPAIIYCSAE